MLTTGQRTGVPNTIWMKVACHIIQKMEMVPAMAGVMVALVAAVAVDVVTIIMADAAPEGIMMVALLPLVLQTQHKDALIHRPRVILTMMLSFCKIT